MTIKRRLDQLIRKLRRRGVLAATTTRFTLAAGEFCGLPRQLWNDLPLAVRHYVRLAIQQAAQRDEVDVRTASFSLALLDLPPTMRLQLTLALNTGRWQGEQPIDYGSTAAEIYQAFAAWGRLGCFAREPDFPVALANLAARIHQTEAPPLLWDGRQPQDGTVDMRAGRWRYESEELYVDRGIFWMMGMSSRLRTGSAPLTVVEYHDLACWFLDHQPRLTVLAGRAGVLLLSKDRRQSMAELQAQMEAGPYDRHAGEAAEKMRQVQGYYAAATSS